MRVLFANSPSARWINRVGGTIYRLFLIGIVSIGLQACATSSVRQVVPAQLVDEAAVVGLNSQQIRFWGDEAPRNFPAMVKKFESQQKAAAQAGARKRPRVHNMLVISGGGSDGAFGAGLLNGWSGSGKRPHFSVVTGVSTGALIAPFAFLGPRYDAVLKEFYTKYSTKDILRPAVLAGLLGGSAVGNSDPLAGLIAKYLTRSLIREIAAEHQKGRRLLVGTTNLDAERPVIWNMGEIASVGTKRALQLMRKVILASASIPGVFPPVLIDVKVNGKVRQEMHVDGGTTDNAILLPIQTNIRAIEKSLKHKAKRRLYIIVNSHVNPEWKKVKASTVDIAGRSIATLIKQQTLGDILKLYGFAIKNKIEFRLATVPDDFNEESKEPFDRAYMTKLFNTGQAIGQTGIKWRRKPPGL